MRMWLRSPERGSLRPFPDLPLSGESSYGRGVLRSRERGSLRPFPDLPLSGESSYE